MEAGDGAAGNGNEQSREHIAKGAARRGDGVFEAGERRHIQRRVAANDADDREDHHRIQQERAEVVTRLEQDPHRRDGSDQNVDAADDHPGLVAQIDRMPLDAEPHDQSDADNADDRNDGRVHKEMPETVLRRAGKAGIVVFDDAPAFRQQGIGVLEHRIIGFE